MVRKTTQAPPQSGATNKDALLPNTQQSENNIYPPVIGGQVEAESTPYLDQESLRSGTVGTPLIDFAIITAIQVEREAVCKVFGLSERVSKGSRVYWRGKIPLKNNKEYEIVVAQSPDMANVAAALLTLDTLHHWQPAAALMVGIAASTNQSVALGDIVVGSHLYYYERGKVTPQGMKSEPYIHTADSTLWAHVTAVSPWTSRVGERRPDPKASRPKVHYGVIASGEKVIADVAKRDLIASAHRKILAIEMEGYGFSNAIWQSFDQVRCLVIRGICDDGSPAKNDEWHSYAAAAAAGFAKHFLLDAPLLPRNCTKYTEFKTPPPAPSLPRKASLPAAAATYSRAHHDSDSPITGSVNEAPHHSEELEEMMDIPAELDEFVGREHELGAIRSSLSVHPHLVTLTGIGGVGKSRLAKHFALQAEAQYGGNKWLIDLADTLNSTQIITKIAEVLGVHEHKRDRQPLISTIQYHLKSKKKDVLLVIDNCEHLLPSCAKVIKKLREQCSSLHCLSTSQEPLGIPGEKVLPLQPFELLDPTKLPPIADVLHNKAIELFMRRSKGRSAVEIELTDQTAKALAQVCWQVDGIPLAIELVAAHLDEFSDIVELTAELTTSNCFKLLEDYSIKERPRHNKMWSTLNWSYRRLKKPERKLLDRLSVFMGGCSLEAASKVCADEIVAAVRIRAYLRKIKLKSLVEYQHQQPKLRYRLLQLIRSFGLKQLKKSGEYMNIKNHHAQYYMELAEKAEAKLRTDKQQEWLAQLESEQDNFRAAIKYCYKQSRNGNKELTLIGLRIVGALSAFWLVRGYWQEGRALIKSMLTSSEGIVDPSRAKAMYGAGRLAWAQIDYKTAKELMEKSFRLYKRLGDKEGMARTLHELGNIERYRFAYDKVIRLYQEAQNLFKEVGDQTGIAWTIHDIGRVSRDKGDTRAAVKNFGLSLKMFQKLGDSRGIAHASHNFAHIERLQTKDKPRHYRKARELYHQCLKSFEVIGDKNGVAWALHHIGTIERYTHNYSKAVSYYESSLNEFQQIENTAGIAWTKRNMGKALLKQNNDELATKLCQESLKIFRDLKDTRGIAAAYSDLGDIAKEHHNSSEATKYYKQSLRLFQKLEDKNSANELSEKLTSLIRK